MKGKVDETLKETEAVYNKMKELAEHKKIEFDAGWIEDVIFSIDTCNSCGGEYMNSKKNRLEFQGQKENKTQHEKL